MSARYRVSFELDAEDGADALNKLVAGLGDKDSKDWNDEHFRLLRSARIYREQEVTANQFKEVGFSG